MNIESKKWRIALSLTSGTLLGMVIAYPDISAGSVLMYASILSSSVFAYGIYSAVNSSRRDLKTAHLLAEALYGFDNAFRENVSDAPTLCKLTEIAKFSNSLALKRILDEVHKRTRFGMRLTEAIGSCSAPSSDETIRVLLQGANVEEGQSIRRMLDSRLLESEEQRSRAEGMLQRNATLGMFVSTVLPSFAIFGFIGNAILGQTAGSMALFSMVMLLLFPSMSLALNITINRVLHA